MATRQSTLLIAVGLAVLLIWSSNASAGNAGNSAGPQKTVCENLKLNASAHYFQCLIDAYRVANTRGGEVSASTVTKCDEQFYRAVERAEAIGGCHTPGNPSVLGDAIKVRAKAVVLGITAELGGCTSLTINDQQPARLARAVARLICLRSSTR